MKTIIRFLVFVTLINFWGCCFTPNKHLIFTSEELKLLHYKENDESRLASDFGDTIKIKIISKGTYTPENTCGGSMCECDQYENCDIGISVINNKDTIKTCQITADKQNNKLNLMFLIFISNETYYSYTTLDQGKLTSSDAYFYNTMTINGFLYTNVYEFTYIHPNDPKSLGKKSHIFYNETFGIIKLAKDSAKTWTLIN